LFTGIAGAKRPLHKQKGTTVLTFILTLFAIVLLVTVIDLIEQAARRGDYEVDDSLAADWLET